MNTISLHAEIAKRNFATLAKNTIRQPARLPEVFEGLNAEKARIKYGCLKLLRLISEQRPELLYPHIGRFFELLGSENNIFKWGAIIIIGNLACVDAERKIDAQVDRYLKPIRGSVMITAANVIGGAGKIAQAKPYLAEKIARAVLRVESAKYQTTECRNVVIGHAIKSLDLFFRRLKQPGPVVEFVKRQLNNRRPAVKKHAAKFLKKYAPREASVQSAPEMDLTRA